MFNPPIPPKQKTVWMTIIIWQVPHIFAGVHELPKSIHGSPCEKALDLKDGFTLRVAKSFRKRERGCAMMRVPFPFR